MDSIWTKTAALLSFERLRGTVKTDVLIIGGTSIPSQKVFHTERPISKAYKELDHDLARGQHGKRFALCRFTGP